MKKFISGLLGILFVVLVVVGVFICTYGQIRTQTSLLNSLTRAISLSLALMTAQLSQRAGLKFRRTGEAERYSFL